MRQVFSVLIFSLTAFSAARGISPQEAEFFEKKVRPVLAEQCYKCHGAEKQKAALRVDSRAGILKGTEDGPVIVEGKPEQSPFIKSIRHEGDSKMPEKGDKLRDEQISNLTEWVRMGLPWPENDAPAKPAAQQAAASSHWSWQPLRNPPVPQSPNPKSAIQNPIDAFLSAKLAEKNLALSPPADSRALCRRIYYDLTGLPPTVPELVAFAQAAAANRQAAVEALADKLLASPRYGERWGRYWLDVARYADTKGYVFQEERRYAYSFTYRDWVIGALNADLPYDQFIILQIAGDQVATPQNPAPNAALGFITLGRRFLNNQPDIIDDRIDLICRGLMGLTVGCARCHDHKFDPISQQDYYALYGVFASSKEPETKDLPLLPSTRDPKVEADYQRQHKEREAAVTAFLEKKRALISLRTLPVLGAFAVVPLESVRPLLDRAGKDEERPIRAKIEELDAGPLAPPRAMAIVDSPNLVKPHVFKRGNPSNPGEEVPRRFISLLSGGNPQPFPHGSGRLDLARAIASKDNPLTARVMVNRVWAGHFGRALVRTPGDFGTKGESPTHPELLDWLASRFIADGWSLKKLHKLIISSAAYQQSSDERPEILRADPDNRLVSHQNRRRLDFEAMRDSLLACAGQLDTTMGGRGEPLESTSYSRRRAIYGFIDRQNLPGLFRTFDFATPDASSPARHTTTVPQQALFMMNSPFVIDRARALVSRPEYQQPQAYEPQIQQLYQRVLARNAESREIDAGLRFVNAAVTAPAPAAEAPVWQYGWGGYDESTHAVSFHPLAKFAGAQWQAGEKIPDATLGFVSLTKDGGHPGRDSAHCAIRRFIAPRDGTLAISGTIRRPAADGDGILARIVSSRQGELLKLETAPGQSNSTQIDKLVVKAGETIDFLVDPRAADTSDGFRWHPTLSGEIGSFDSAAQFSGPAAAKEKPLTPWEQYAQVLLETNEFIFVD